MDSKSIPLLKLLPLTQEAVFKNLTVDEIIHVSALSAKARNAINNARIAAKFVSIKRKKDFGSVEIQLRTGPELCWKFVQLPEGMDSNANFRELADQVQSDGLSKINCVTVSNNWSSTMTTVFDELNDLFKIVSISICDLTITMGTPGFHQDPLIQHINRCKTLSLRFDRPHCPNLFPVDWLLQKIYVKEKLEIDNRNGGSITYSAPFHSKKIVLIGFHDWNSISVSFLINVAQIHFLTNNAVPVEKMNSILRAWKQGNLPNLVLIEYREGMNSGNQYMRALLQGFDDMDWDRSREATFSKHCFHMAAGLVSMHRSMKFREGRDIRRDDGMMATVIPCMSRISNNDFFFMVWSRWMKPGLVGRPNGLEYHPRFDF